MSARNMIRNLRDSGALQGPPPSNRARTAAHIVFALCLGAGAFFCVTLAFPLVASAMKRQPVEIVYARVGAPETNAR